MINFAVGPVMSNDEILKIGAEQVPYFRTEEFSKLMKENESLFLRFVNASKESKAVFLTGSGTASMEAAISNLLTNKDKVFVINGGSFGQRFVDILSIYGVKYTEIIPEKGYGISKKQLDSLDAKGYTAFLVNLHETSTGVLYDVDLISSFCKEHRLLFIVDAISCFLTDRIDMKKSNIDVLLTGSQKALACAPGISILGLSKRAIDRIFEVDSKIPYYLSLSRALKDMERGQTPFTPAVGILRQINARFKQIDKDGGVKSEISKTNALALYFRNKIKDLPFEITSFSPSNAVTPLHPYNVDAYSIFETLKNEYDIWVCPNGGSLKHDIFRVGHMGDLKEKDYDTLIDALKDMQMRGML